MVAPNRKDVNSINKNQIRTLGTNLIQHLSFLTKYIMAFFLHKKNPESGSSDLLPNIRLIKYIVDREIKLLE